MVPKVVMSPRRVRSDTRDWYTSSILISTDADDCDCNDNDDGIDASVVEAIDIGSSL